MRRFTWEEMQKYWESHNSQRATLDFDRDPDGLDNVLRSGEPLWLNEYYARHQRAVYEELLSLVPPARRGARALDVGCGAGRWCTLLAQRGYETSGIDLQPELIDSNRRRYPKICFFRASVQEFAPEKCFDLVSSVTVIQHNPFLEQEAIVRKLRAVTKPGGYTLILENIRDQDPHVFANSVRKWQSMFEGAGFEAVALKPYDYNLLSRSYLSIRRRLVSSSRRLLSKGVSKGATEYSPESFMAKRTGGQRGLALRYSLRLLDSGAKRLVFGLDSILEPTLVRSNFALPSVHCGFLFRAK